MWCYYNINIVSIQFADFGFFVVVEEDLFKVIAFVAHHGGSYLAEAYAMAPSCSIKGEALWNSVPNLSPFYYEG